MGRPILQTSSLQKKVPGLSFPFQEISKICHYRCWNCLTLNLSCQAASCIWIGKKSASMFPLAPCSLLTSWTKGWPEVAIINERFKCKALGTDRELNHCPSYQRTSTFKILNAVLNDCFQIPFSRSKQHGIRNMIWEAKTRRRNNLPEGVVSPSLVSIDEELFSGTTWPKFIWELEENLCIYHHITFLYGLCFPPLHYYFLI